jgi:hypothetical protein
MSSATIALVTKFWPEEFEVPTNRAHCVEKIG